MREPISTPIRERWLCLDCSGADDALQVARAFRNSA